MSVIFGLAPVLRKTTDLGLGVHYVDTDEALDSNLWSAGDLSPSSGCGSVYSAHTCMTSRKQFYQIFDRFDYDIEDTVIVQNLVRSIRKYGQYDPADVVYAEGRFTVHNGHHRFYACHILKIPYYIDVGYD